MQGKRFEQQWDRILQRLVACRKGIKVRGNRALSCRQASLAIRQNENYVNKMERKEFVPPLAVLYELCGYYGVDLWRLLLEDENYPPALADIIGSLQQMDAEELATVQAMVEGLVCAGYTGPA